MSKKRIMVVEDEGIVSLDIQHKLEGLGYDVPAVLSSGELAIERIRDLAPDLVLMDIQLSGEIDGVEAAEQIRQGYDIPVVYLTAFSDEKTLNRAKEAEPFGYLLKPFAERELHTSIEVALYKHSVEQEKSRLESQLRQAQKMEAIGELTTGIAHKFNSLLHGMMGNVDLALPSVTDELRPYLESALFDGQQAAQLTKQLTLYHLHDRGGRRSIDMGALVADVVKTCREIFARKQSIEIDLVVDVEAELPKAHGDPPQLRQCISNLCVNAQEALEVRPAGDAPPPSY